ncbi:MAG: hypothetical protein AAF799_41945 [Myxococcota bacterium]
MTVSLAAGCVQDTVPIDDDNGSTSDTVETTTGVTPNTSEPATSSTTDEVTSSSSGTPPAESTGEPTTSATDTGATSVASGDETGTPTVCGNNVVEGDEVCDLAQLGGETCESLGFQGGQLGCLLTCDDYNILGCFVCGNEVVDIAEDCEGSVPKEVTCESMGFEAGTVTCGADCLFDTSDCSICGDGIQQGPEDCDGLDVQGNDCAAIGFDSGELGCNIPTCGYDYSGCEGGQYIQDFEGGPPMPLEFTTMGAADWVVDGVMPINGSFSAWSTDLGEGQNNSLLIDATFAVDGDISFWHREDSEATFDFLEFYIDGVLIDSWSGINPAAMFTTPVTAGVHSFEWRYAKDGIVSVGLDSVWVDDITMIPGVPI